MKVLLASAEAHPFIKTGGLGDVIGALPKYLKRIGVEARVIIPKYRNINEKMKSKLQYIKNIRVRVGWRNQYCGIFKADVDGITYYFIDNEQYFNRDGNYGYFDDGERFAFFDRAVLEVLKEVGFQPDVIHCNDWQTGMIPVLLDLEYKKDWFYLNMKTVFSIHNLLFQGNFDPKILPELFGYDMEPFYNRSLEFKGGVSFMKGGINYSDKISTVSYTYSQEIKTAEYGEGLEGLLRKRNYALRGILNGIDYDEYNPETDNFIMKKFNIDSIEDKQINKLDLQKELRLPMNKEVPLIGIVSRLTRQKGMDIISYVVENLLNNSDVQLVVLGTGDNKYEHDFKYFKNKYPDRVSVNLRFDNGLAHRIYAGSDMFLMPSLFEPCGLGQLIALRYGTIPIVRETGGLKDTIIPYNKYTGEGNGFSFMHFNGEELFDTIMRAINVYRDKNKWNNIIRQAMLSDNSWEKSANEYLSLYKEMSQG